MKEIDTLSFLTEKDSYSASIKTDKLECIILAKAVKSVYGVVILQWNCRFHEKYKSEYINTRFCLETMIKHLIVETVIGGKIVQVSISPCESIHVEFMVLSSCYHEHPNEMYLFLFMEFALASKVRYSKYYNIITNYSRYVIIDSYKNHIVW